MERTNELKFVIKWKTRHFKSWEARGHLRALNEKRTRKACKTAVFLNRYANLALSYRRHRYVCEAPNCQTVFERRRITLCQGKCCREEYDCKLLLSNIFKDRYVICRPGGPYWERLCQRSSVRSEAADRGPYSRPRAQFFPIRTDLGRQRTCLFFYSVEYFVSSFCVEFSLQPFSNLMYACVWHLGNRK